jgi:hypothetical protein
MRSEDHVVTFRNARLGLLALGLVACARSADSTPYDSSPARGDGDDAEGGASDGRGGTLGPGGGPSDYDSGSPSWGDPYDSGTPTPPPADTGVVSGPCATPMIDDMEHGDGSILSSCGRHGYWYTYNDATAGASQVPAAGAPFIPAAIPGGRAGSAHAAHSTGSGFTAWGAGLAFDLASAGGTAAKDAYDAGAYHAITFWAKSGTGSSAAVRLNIASRGTDPAGGVCTPASKCNDHFGASVTLSSTWEQHTVSFSDLHQLGWGTPAGAFDPTRLYAVQFQTAAGQPFDVWIDDIAFAP